MALKTDKGRLTPQGVEHIHKLRAAGKTYQAIAEEMKLSLTTVYQVCTKKTHAK